MMRERQISRVILVSDPFHMLRLRVLARQLGLTPFTSPTQTELWMIAGGAPRAAVAARRT